MAMPLAVPIGSDVQRQVQQEKGIMNRMGLAAVSVLLAATPAMAQHQHAPPQQAPRREQPRPVPAPTLRIVPAPALRPQVPITATGGAMGNRKMTLGGSAPGRLLEHREQLGLTADQMSRLEILQAEASTAGASHMRIGMEGHIAAAALLKGDNPDLAAYETKLREMSEHMLQAQVGMARIAVQARAVLTPAQREAIPSSPAGDQSEMACPRPGEAHAGAAGHHL